MTAPVFSRTEQPNESTQSRRRSPRLLMITNNPDTLVSHRLSVALAARDQGYDVHIATPGGDSVREIRDHDLTHHRLPLSRGGTNPLAELGSVLAFVRLFVRLKPDIAHLITIKPLLYGGIAARLARVPGLVSAVAGLGYVFTADSVRARWLRRLITPFYRFALGHPSQYVIFQNQADRDLLARLRVLRRASPTLIHGSGVNLDDYPLRDEPDGLPVVTFASRLLREKGVEDFRRAALVLRERGIEARFWLIGSPDDGNPGRISEAELDTWRREGIVNILGFRRDIADLFAQSHIITLPSFYGEGLPKVLIEAAASGRAVVTTDIPGCRDAVLAGQSGLLVPPRDSHALADAIERLLTNHQLRRAMGRNGRALAEKSFNIETVIAQHLSLYRDLTQTAIPE